jgi:hypothetical protein
MMNADMNALIRAEYEARNALADADLAFWAAKLALDASWSKETQAKFDSADTAFREALKAFNVASIRRKIAAL